MYLCILLESPCKAILNFIFITAQLSNTTIALGELSTTDVKQNYRSAASNKFKPYIVNPETTHENTDRNLYKRYIQDSYDFYMSLCKDCFKSFGIYLVYP